MERSTSDRTLPQFSYWYRRGLVDENDNNSETGAVKQDLKTQ